jgi:hypothetical protein
MLSDKPHRSCEEWLKFPRDGVAPVGGVVIDHNGNLFGTTGVGGSGPSGGTLYELSPPAAQGDPWTETILHRFHGVPDGKTPLSRLAMTSTGSLIGTTVHGGVNDLGTAYMFSPLNCLFVFIGTLLKFDRQGNALIGAALLVVVPGSRPHEARRNSSQVPL